MTRFKNSCKAVIAALTLFAATRIGGTAIVQKGIDDAILETLSPKEVAEQVETNDKALKFLGGYNALQVGLTDEGVARFRLYTNLGIEGKKMHLRYHGMNEAGPDYAFGREAVMAGKNDFPVELLYATRFAGELSDLARIDEAIGLRIDIKKLPGINYGFLDTVKHTGNGASGYDGVEAVLFAGKNIGTGALEMTAAFKEGGQRYIEFETISPKIKLELDNLVFRGYVRLELPDMNLNNPTAIIGVQVQR